MEALFFQAASKNLLLGFMPDALGLLIFGIALIVFAGSLRWFLNRKTEVKSEKFSASQLHQTIG